MQALEKQMQLQQGGVRHSLAQRAAVSVERKVHIPVNARQQVRQQQCLAVVGRSGPNLRRDLQPETAHRQRLPDEH